MFSLIESLKSSSILEIILVVTGFLFAVLIGLTIHEYAHAKVAYSYGDYTPKAQGRLTLNPLAHINLIGFFSLLLMGFGWAKPVPVNPLKFKEFRKGIFSVSVAGVLTNLATGFIFAGLLILFTMLESYFFSVKFIYYIFFFLRNFSGFMATINISLFVFNLLPIYPLDGFNIIASVVGAKNKLIQFLTKYGSLILFGLVFADYLLNLYIFESIVNFVLNPIITFWARIFLG